MRKSNGTRWLAPLMVLWGTAAGASEIPFPKLPGGAVVVPVVIDGLGAVPFLLDTGSGLTWIDDGIARALDLPNEGEVDVTTLNGAGRLTRSHVPRLALGPRVVERVAVMVGPLPPLGLGTPVRGILGQSVLARVSFGIDYRRRRVVFDPIEGRSSVRVPLEWRLGRPAALARDGEDRPLTLVLDAGLDEPVLFEKEGRPLPYESVPGLAFDTSSLVSDSRLRAVSVPDVHAGPIRLGRLRAAVAPDAMAGGREEDGLLPTRMFASVYFDHAAGEVALEAR